MPSRRVPRTRGELQAVIEERPRFWEYLQFAGVLFLGKQDLETKWFEYEMRPAHPPGPLLSRLSALALVTETLNAGPACIRRVTRRLDMPGAKDAAFGPPGVAGDPQRIEQLALDMVSVYDELLELALRTGRFQTSQDFGPILELTGAMLDRPIRQIRAYMERTIEQLDQIPELIGTAEGRRVTLDLTLTVTWDDAVALRLNQQIDRLNGDLGLEGP